MWKNIKKKVKVIYSLRTAMLGILGRRSYFLQPRPEGQEPGERDMAFKADWLALTVSTLF